MKGFFRTMFLAGLVVLAVLCCGCGRESAGAWEAVDVAMGTMVRLKVYGPEEERAGEIFSQAREILQSLEEDELSWRLETSEVYRINASAGDGKGEALSAEMAQVLQTCLELYEKSEGAFDVTLGALVRLWKIDSWAGGAETGEFQAPSAGSLEEALGRCGSSMVGLLPKDSWQEGTRLLLPEGMQLDLGAVGKGLALSRILELLEEGEELSLCRHLETGRELYILNDYLRRGPGGLECEDSTDYRLPVASGEVLTVVRKTRRGFLCKKEGSTGWYYGRLSDIMV